MLSSLIERLLHPLDRIRHTCLRIGSPWIHPLLRSRERRITLTACIWMLGALCTTLLVPLWALALGPIIWGVPHLLGDVRYLVVRTGYIHRRSLWLCAGIPLLLISLMHRLPFIGRYAHAGVVLSLGSCICILLCIARTSTYRRIVGTAFLGLGLCIAYELGWVADLLFAHAHNFIAIGLWWSWRRRTSKIHIFPLILFGCIALGLILGGFEFIPWTQQWKVSAPAQGDWMHSLLTLAPGVPQQWGIRLVLLFAFAQSVHYVIWIRLIPEEDRVSATPRSFSASYRALRKDLGDLFLLGTCLTSLGLIAWSVLDLMAAQMGYLKFALFHGHLELIAATLLWSESQEPSR